MIQITYRDGSTRVFPRDKLAAICLELAGGGYTEKQTAKAMLMQSQLLKANKVKHRGIKLEVR